jgi:hypothetical protein
MKFNFSSRRQTYELLQRLFIYMFLHIKFHFQF